METENEHFPLPDSIISEIKFLAEIAKANGSLVSLEDIAALTHVNLSEEYLEANWSATPELAAFYELKNGLMLERQLRAASNHLPIIDMEMQKRTRAESYFNFARDFVNLCRGEKPILFAISGSTSYKTASETDDLDFFCVTKPESLWIFLTKTLLLSRFFRLFRRRTPRICLSYAVDQSFAEKDFATSSDALFARDALTTIVIHGTESYIRLLKRHSWISRYFPRLYQQRTSVIAPHGREHEIRKWSSPSPARKFLNLFLCFLVGNYIDTKSAMLNRKFRKRGMSTSLFTVRIGSDHCVFESVRYSHLRTLYDKLNWKPTKTEKNNLLSRRRGP